MSRKKVKKIVYTNEPMGPAKIVADFLPPPEELVFQEEMVEVTIVLSKKSLEYFKKEARRYHTQYDWIIRRLVDVYVEHQLQIQSVEQ